VAYNIEAWRIKEAVEVTNKADANKQSRQPGEEASAFSSTSAIKPG
jgi:hypothetical protein